MSEKVPIGEIIKQKLKDNDRSVAWLAKKANCDRSNFSKKLNNNNIEIDLLLRISEILQEDFFTNYTEVLSGKIYHKNV
jgi:plasmid maintenance system antidote protein VapI